MNNWTSDGLGWPGGSSLIDGVWSTLWPEASGIQVMSFGVYCMCVPLQLRHSTPGGFSSYWAEVPWWRLSTGVPFPPLIAQTVCKTMHLLDVDHFSFVLSASNIHWTSFLVSTSQKELPFHTVFNSRWSSTCRQHGWILNRDVSLIIPWHLWGLHEICKGVPHFDWLWFIEGNLCRTCVQWVLNQNILWVRTIFCFICMQYFDENLVHRFRNDAQGSSIYRKMKWLDFLMTLVT